MTNPYSYVSFYMDSSSVNVNESANNSTTESVLESQFISTLEGMSKDIHFMAQTMGFEKADQQFNGLVSSIGSISESMGNQNGFMDRLIGSSTDILKGSNIIFPEIWNDSNYDRPFDISLTLHSPYGNKEALFLNNMVPMFFVLGMAIGRQTSANGYTSPFILKASSPGWFNSEMAIIDSLRIEKSEWTVDGLPSLIKINFSLKDLYSSLMITPTNQPANFFNNTGLMDFLALTAGVDITKPQLEIKINTIYNTLINRVTDIVPNTYEKVMESFRKAVADLVKL